jgi:hypothetical protein
MVRKEKKQKKGEEIDRLPLPGGFKDDIREPTDKELPPRMSNLIENFRLLCQKDKLTDEDFIKIAPVTADDEADVTLDPGYSGNDRYMKIGANGCVETTINSYAVDKEDYSGAKKAVIEAKVGKRAAKKEKQKEREKSKGKGWFDMKAPEMTEELKNDLELMQMRGALDPKRFYKKSDKRNLPKYFALGTVVDSPYDFYSDRINTKDRKRTLVDELLADAKFKKYNKRKYVEIIEAKQTHQNSVRRGGKKKKH